MGGGRGDGEKLLLTVVLAAVFLLSFFQVCSPDTFWHLKAGEVMLEGGRLLTENTFSSTYPDHPWTDMEWLFQVILALVYRGGGWTAVLAFKIFLLGLSAAFLFRLLQRRCGSTTAAAVTVFVFAAMRFRFLVRPHILSLLFFVILLTLVNDSPRLGKRKLLILAPLFILWSNVHPEFIFGLFYLGITALLGLWGRTASGDKGGTGLVTVTAVCTLATLVNPGFSHSLLLPLEVLGLEEVIRISEYDRSSFGVAPLFWIFTVAAALSSAVTGREGKRRDLPVFLAFALIGFLYLRAIPYSLAVSALFLCRNLRVRGRRRQGVLFRAALVVAALSAFTWAMHFDRNLPYRWGTGVRESVVPVAAANFIAREKLPRNIFNHYVYGGFLIYRLYPAYRVFQDGRFFPYPTDFLARLHARFDRADWDALLDEFGVRTALVYARDVGGLFNRERWAVVFWDDRFAVLVRRDPSRQDLLDRLEYRRYYPGTDAPMRGEAEYLEALLREVSRNQEERLHGSALVERERSEILARLGRREEARGAYEEALRLDGGLEAAGKKPEALPR
jgi:hypothetical protein